MAFDEMTAVAMREAAKYERRIRELEAALRRLQCEVGVSVEAHDIIAAVIGTPQNPRTSGVTPSDEARELTVHYSRLGTHVENFALSLGWKREDGEGAFEFVQRKSYRQGWEDGKQEGSGDIHRDGVGGLDGD